MVYATELYHHGVKGMKWGIRRYQRKDGSLTPEGKKRYSDDAPSSSSKVATQSKGTTSSKSSSPAKKTISELSDDELRAKINRLQLEKQYKDLAKQTAPPDSSKRAKDFVLRVLEKSGENIATQLTTVLMGEGVNKTIGKLLNDANLVNPKKGQKDK